MAKTDRVRELLLYLKSKMLLLSPKNIEDLRAKITAEADDTELFKSRLGKHKTLCQKRRREAEVFAKNLKYGDEYEILSSNKKWTKVKYTYPKTKDQSQSQSRIAKGYFYGWIRKSKNKIT